MTLHAVDEHELVHCPSDRFDRIFLNFAFDIHERNVRGEISLGQTLQALPRQRNTKRSSKQPQPIHPVIPDENKRTIAGPASKGGGAIEPNFERLGPYFNGSLTCYLNEVFRRLTEKEERDVQALRFDDGAVEFVGKLERARQPTDPRRRISIGNDSQK